MISQLKICNLFRRIRGFQSSLRLIDKGDFTNAQKILRAELERGDSSCAVRVLLADCRLLQSQYARALAEYKAAHSLLERSKSCAKRDRVFLTAYINFRKLSIAHKQGKQTFPAWPEAARQINLLPAKTLFKRAFTLPEK